MARGLGVTIVPRSVGAARQPLRLIDIQPPITLCHTALAWSTGRTLSPAAQAFLTSARAWLADQAGALERPHVQGPDDTSV